MEIKTKKVKERKLSHGCVPFYHYVFCITQISDSLNPEGYQEKS